MQLWKLDPILGVTGAIDKFMAEKSKRFQDQQKATEKFRYTTFEIGKEWEKFTEDLSTSALSADGVIVHGLELANSILKEIHSGWNGIFDSPTAKYFTTVLSFLVSPLSAANQIYNKLHGDGAKQPAGGGQPTDVPRSTREEDLRHSPWLAGPSKNTGTAPLRFADLPATGGGEGEGQRSGGGAFKHFDEWLASKPASEHIEDRRNETRAAVADIKDDYLKDLNENTTQVKKLNEYFKLLDEGGEGRQGLGRLLGRGGMGIGGGGGGGGGGGPNGSSVGPGTGPGATQSTSPSSPTTTESKPTEPLASPSEAPAVRGAEGVQGLPGTQSGPAASRGGGYDPESGMTYPPTAGYGGGGGGGSATGVRGLPGSPSGPAVRRPTPDASAAPPQSPAAPGGGAAPRSVGPGGYSLADQKGHQYYEHGGVTLGGQTYHWGSGGGGAGAIEYGTYNINVATPYGGKGQLGPVGNRIGSVATLGGLGGTYKGSHDWEGVQIHRAFNDNLDKLYTAGCFSIKASEWPKFKQHLIEEGRKHPEGLQLTVGPNGMASITSRGSGQELVPSKARDAANDDRKQGPVHAASAAASVTPGGSKAGAPVGPKEGGVLPGDDPGSGGPGSHGGRFNAPTGARIAPGSQLETVTLSNGQKVTVNKKAAGQFKGFFNDLIAAGAPVRSLGGPGMRGNPSQHPNALAVDWAQHSRDVVDPDVRKWIDSHRDLMAGFEKRWGISGGENWGHKDTGHVSIDTLYGEEHLKQAQIASAGGEDRATVDAAAAPKSVRTIKVDAGGKLTANINAPANTSVKVEGSGGFKSTETNRTMPPGGGGAPKSTTTPSGPSKADLAAAAAAPG
jgi:hypothetical protein